MNLGKSFQNLDVLSDTQLRHVGGLLEQKIKDYVHAIENYPPERMDRVGKPHMAKLVDQLQSVKSRLGLDE